MQSQETLINPGFGVGASFQGCHQKTEKEAYFQMDSVEIPRLFQWKCNLRAKCFYSVGLILHNCCHLYLSGALIVLGCSEAARNAVLTTSSSVTTTSASRWSGSATARRTARWARTRETAKEQVKKKRNDGKKINPVRLLNTYGSNKFEALPPVSEIWLIEEKVPFWVEVIEPADPTGVWAPGQHGLGFTHESAPRSSLFLTCSTSRAADLTPAAFPVLPTCSVNEYVCASGGCVSASLRCDGHDNCLDGSDEVSAPPPTSFTVAAPTAATAGSIHQRALFSPTRSRHLSPQTSENVPAALRWTRRKALTPSASCPHRSAAWKSAGRTSSSVWTGHTASRAAGAATTSSTAWTTATRKTAARVGVGVHVHGLRQQGGVGMQMVW